MLSCLDMTISKQLDSEGYRQLERIRNSRIPRLVKLVRRRDEKYQEDRMDSKIPVRTLRREKRYQRTSYLYINRVPAVCKIVKKKKKLVKKAISQIPKFIASSRYMNHAECLLDNSTSKIPRRFVKRIKIKSVTDEKSIFDAEAQEEIDLEEVLKEMKSIPKETNLLNKQDSKKAESIDDIVIDWRDFVDKFDDDPQPIVIVKSNSISKGEFDVQLESESVHDDNTIENRKRELQSFIKEHPECRKAVTGIKSYSILYKKSQLQLNALELGHKFK